MALKGKLPKLVTDRDLRGILHCHTDASDGTAAHAASSILGSPTIPSRPTTLAAYRSSRSPNSSGKWID